MDHKNSKLSENGFPCDKYILEQYADKAIEAGLVIKPGILLYAETCELIISLSPTKAGKLAQAAAKYHLYGEVTDFSGDKLLELGFANIMRTADRDTVSYAETALRNKYRATGKYSAGQDGKRRKDRPPFHQWFMDLLRRGDKIDFDDGQSIKDDKQVF